MRPPLGPAVVPTTVVMLMLLFLIQSRKTGAIGKLFGPVMLCWFVAIGALGIDSIASQPRPMPTNRYSFCATRFRTASDGSLI